MGNPTRVTGPLLDVLEVLLDAHADGRETHGWVMAKQTKRSGPTVYNVITRLEDFGWITGRWEEQQEDLNRPRRRLYRLTPDGAESARALLAERRPEWAQPKVRPAIGFALRALLDGLRRVRPEGVGER